MTAHTIRYSLRIVLVLLTLLPAIGNSTDRNVWQDGGYYFANGLSDDSSELKAREDSCSNAKRELIGFLFGVKVKVDQKVTSTLSDVTLSENVSISSDAVKLVGATTEISSQNGITKCLLKYSEKNAITEKNRIDSMAKTLRAQKLNKATFENSDPTHFGILTIKSNVKDAKVFIDSVLFGKAPLEIDRVPTGKHTLILETVGYKSNTQDIELGLGERKIIFITLERNLAVLELEILPKSLKYNIWIDGIQRGAESTFKLEPGARVLRVEANNYFSAQDHVQLEAGQILKQTITLVPKKVPVTFISKSQKARVFVAGALIGETTLEKELEPGHYAIQFISDSKGIFFSQDIDVKPGTPLTVVADGKSGSVPSELKQLPIMVYSDLSLSKGMGYENVSAIPEHSPNTLPTHIILDGPTSGFISVDGKLAGTKEIIIDKVDRPFKVKVEAPGFYSDELQIGILPTEKNLNCTYILDRYSDDLGKPCPDPNVLRASDVVIDPVQHREPIIIHPFKVIPQSPGMPLATIVLVPTTKLSYGAAGIPQIYPIYTSFYLDWLKLRFRGTPFTAQAKRINSVMSMTIPASLGKIPAAVVYGRHAGDSYSRPRYYEITTTGLTTSMVKLSRIFEGPAENSREFNEHCESQFSRNNEPCSFKIQASLDGIEVAQRVIVILESDSYTKSSFPTYVKDLGSPLATESTDSKRYSR